MRFTSAQDYSTIVNFFNKELINTVIDNNIILYKLHQEITKTNSYGEATKKTWYIGVQIPGLINRTKSNPSDVEHMTVTTEQDIEVYFLRQECKDRNIYPEMGDIILYASQYYEIDNTNEIQRVAGIPDYNHSIVCSAHLTRTTTLQLDMPTV